MLIVVFYAWKAVKLSWSSSHITFCIVLADTFIIISHITRTFIALKILLHVSGLACQTYKIVLTCSTIDRTRLTYRTIKVLPITTLSNTGLITQFKAALTRLASIRISASQTTGRTIVACIVNHVCLRRLIYIAKATK